MRCAAGRIWRMPASTLSVRYLWLPTPAGRLSPRQRHWLFRPGALTAGLRALGEVRLRVTREFSTGLPRIDAITLNCPAGTPVWVREVVMSIDGVDRVSARSIALLPASKSVWSGMRRLNTRPLADMLYGDRDISRDPFTWRQLSLGDPLWYAVTRLHGQTTHASASAGQPLFARQSVFWRSKQPLLVQECFLPAFWTIAARAVRKA